MGCLKTTLAVVVAAVAISLGVGYSPFRGLVQLVDYQARVRDKAALEVRGLKGRKVVLRRHPETGVIQSEGENEPDMIFGQGYALAADRLFQVEVFRRLAKGELADMVGEKALPIDKWHKTMDFKALGRQDYEYLKEDQPVFTEILNSFAAGMNAYLENKTLLDMPVELMVLGVVPEPVQPYECISFQRWHTSAMNKGWQNELLYTKLYSELDRNIVEAIRIGLAYDVHEVAGGMGSTFNKVNEWNVKQPWVDPAFAGMSENGGSNGWVLSGKYTKSGKPIMANDPHLPFTLPALWHNVRLTCHPCKIDQIGMAVPFMPYIISGHNNFSAYGVTLNRCDGDDIFLEKVCDNNGTYLDSDGSYQPLKTRFDVIKVKGKPDVNITISSTRRGPLVCHLLGIEHQCSLSSLSSLSSETYRNEFDGSNLHCIRELMLARDMEFFRFAGSHTSVAMLNMMYIDVEGNIGYTMTGRVPRRKEIGDQAREGWNPEHQYDGWLPYSDMPYTLNPEKGYIVSANQKPYKTGEGPELGSVWQHGWRAKRIEELIETAIEKNKKIDGAMSMEWQRDLVSIPGREFSTHITQNVTVLKGNPLVAANPILSQCIDLVTSWNGSMDVNSPQAVIYTVTKEFTIRNVLQKFVKSEGTIDELMGVGFIAAGKASNDLEGRQAAFFLRILEGTHGMEALMDGRGVHDVLLKGMLEGSRVVKDETGKSDPSTWRWGELHTAKFNHPLGKVKPLDHLFNIEAGEVPGDVDTISLAAFLHQRVPHEGLPLPSPMYVQRGFAASSRLVIDMVDLQHLNITVAPGNSGRPSSPYYDDKTGVLTVPTNEGIVPISLTDEDTAKQPVEVVLTPR